MFQVTDPAYGDYSYPRWAVACGWCVGIVSLIPIPVVAVMELRKQNGPIQVLRIQSFST